MCSRILDAVIVFLRLARKCDVVAGCGFPVCIGGIWGKQVGFGSEGCNKEKKTQISEDP